MNKKNKKDRAIESEAKESEALSVPVLACRHLCKTFRLPGAGGGSKTNAINVLDGVDFELPAGRSAAITGVSGAGKTTLLSILGGLEKPDAGEVFVSGTNLTKLNANQLARLRNGKIGFVYQFHHLLAEFTALENVAMPLLLRGLRPSAAGKEALHMLDLVGLSARADHKPAELSGGERQRVAVARALAGKPICVMLDEPSGNLDTRTATEMHELLVRLNRELGVAMLTVTHNTGLAAMMKEQYVLQNGNLLRVRRKQKQRPEPKTKTGTVSKILRRPQKDN